MSRKNRRMETFEPEPFEDEPWKIEIQAREMREFAREQFDTVLSRLSPMEQSAFWNMRYARSATRERTLHRTAICQLPNCDQPTIRLAGRSLGICDRHAMDVITWWSVIADDHEQRMLKAAAEVKRIHRIEAEEKAEIRRLERNRSQPGWIYYVQVGDRIKIGYSVDVKRRLKSYPPDSPLLAMHPGTKATETDMHAKFAGSKVAGREWFLDTPELRTHIDDVIEQFGEPDRARYEHRGRMHSGLRAAPPKPTGISR